MGFSDLALGRRDFTRLTTAATASAAYVAARAAPAGAARQHRLRRLPEGVDVLDLPLGAAPVTARRRDGFRTTVIETTTFTVLGVTWGRGEGRVRARWRRQRGGWTAWRTLPRLAHGPDSDSVEATAARAATDLVWTGPSNAVQVELTGTQRDPVLALLRPRRLPSDVLAGGRRGPGAESTGDDESEVDGDAARKRDGGVPMPGLLYRKAWNPNPRLRNGRPEYNRRVRQVHVHHTVNSNDYRRADVPGMIRAMYRYHTQSLGWSDIGYNFLVDRFGRLWEGRAGGPRRRVRGAHTLGFNHQSVGVAAIGNLHDGRVGKPMMRALVRVASWKLDLDGGRPRRTVWIRSSGSDRYAYGELVELPTIDGHRDTNDTACPGDHLYAALPAVRRRTARRIRRFRRP